MTRAEPHASPLAHVDTWVFDLDNTLYPAHCNLFAEIDRRMTEFVSRFLRVDPPEARRIQKTYYAEHGTTLNGLMIRHGLSPEAFLDYVHDIDLAPLEGAPDLTGAIAALPGRRFVFTNGSQRHAERVLEKLGLSGLFNGCIDIAASGFTPKHERIAYERFLVSTGSDPAASVMFEDLARNLEPAAALGFTTVLVRSGHDWSHEPAAVRPAGPADKPAHVHHFTDDLQAFLLTMTPRAKPVGAAGKAG